MIAIIDYGVGNLFSLTSSLRKLGLESVVTSDKDAIRASDRIILPGVGAFADAAKKLDDSGLGKIVVDEAKAGKPVMGICLGMQLLFEKSYEYGESKGLGLIKGGIYPLSGDVGALKVPHIGWNSLNIVKRNGLFRYTDDDEYVYFVHSYYAKNCPDTSAYCEYGAKVCAAVENENVTGTQFHPEKSGDTGLKILKAFGEMK